MSEIYDVIIIGSGPAGLTAGIYASRANLKTLVFEGWQPGGQLTTTTLLENFPGFKDGIQGPEFMQDMRLQAERFNTKLLRQNVDEVDFSSRPFKIISNGEEYLSKTVIVATGAKSRRLGLKSEEKLWAKGVSVCATCDGFFFRDKEVAVIGAGDSAMEEAMFLTKFANKVYVVNRSDIFRASDIMLARAKDNEKIEILTNKETVEILGENHVEGIRFKDAVSGELEDLKLDGVFLAIGHMPNTELFVDKLEMDAGKYILQKENTMTSVAGVFVAGDVSDRRYCQAITSAGEGCKAALDAKRFIDEE